MKTKIDNTERLLEIKDEIKELVNEAMSLLPRDGMTRSRAEAYWQPHILMALDKDHGYLGGSMETLQDAIDEMENGDEEDGGE